MSLLINSNVSNGIQHLQPYTKVIVVLSDKASRWLALSELGWLAFYNPCGKASHLEIPALCWHRNAGGG